MTQTNNELSQDMAVRATALWYNLMPDTHAGHPGLPGPIGNEPWNSTKAHIECTITTLQQILDADVL